MYFSKQFYVSTLSILQKIPLLFINVIILPKLIKIHHSSTFSHPKLTFVNSNFSNVVFFIVDFFAPSRLRTLGKRPAATCLLFHRVQSRHSEGEYWAINNWVSQLQFSRTISKLHVHTIHIFLCTCYTHRCTRDWIFPTMLISTSPSLTFPVTTKTRRRRRRLDATSRTNELRWVALSEGTLSLFSREQFVRHVRSGIVAESRQKTRSTKRERRRCAACVSYTVHIYTIY